MARPFFGKDMMTMLENHVPVWTKTSRHTGRSVKRRRLLGRPAPRLRVHRTGTGPRRFTAAAADATAAAVLAVAIWLSATLRPSPVVHDIALFVHLSSLVLGFGAVLVADYFFALWVLRRLTFAEAVANTAHLHLLVWFGLTGLVASGTLLEPDLYSPTTVLKLAFVAILTFNGVQAMTLSKRMAAAADGPPPRLLARGAVITAVSQICWWGAVLIGFLNANR
jgi:hypothetical protein